MFFPPTQRHAPQRNVLPNGPSRDNTARREIARLSALVEELKRELRTQFTRMADLQAEVDELKQRMKRTVR
jgi:molecular chaperone GrpE (heat shock protein)